MLEFVYITDTHFYDRNPPSRTDSYLETGLKKLDTVLQYANEHGITRIVHGGDFFGTTAHARNLSWAAWNQVAERIEEQGHIDWYSNVGQHDLSAHAHESLMGMPLGCLSRLPNFRILPNDKKVNLGHAEDIPVYIIGRWFDFHKTATPQYYRLAGVREGTEYLILTTHGLLVNKPFFGNYVILDSIGPSEANLFLASDYHPGWKTRKSADPFETTYLAPGSLLRPEKVADREPKLLHIKIGDGKIKWQAIVVSQEFPFHESLPTIQDEHVKEVAVDYPGITDKITEETKEIQFVNPVEYVNQIAAEAGYSDDVRKCTLQFLERAERVLAKK